MPQTTKTTHPLDQNLVMIFTEEDHSYVDSNGLRYDSATAIVGQQFLPFDARAAAARVAMRERCEVDDVLAAWKAKADYASRYGTRCHELSESYLTAMASGEDHEPEDEKEAIAFEAVRLACLQLSQWFELIACERVLFSPGLRLAGTCDLLMRARDGSVMLLDWKTNERHKLMADGYGNGLGLCKNVPNCALGKYELQLSLYEDLLRSEGHVRPQNAIHRALIWIEPFCARPLWMPLRRRDEATEILNRRRADLSRLG